MLTSAQKISVSFPLSAKAFYSSITCKRDKKNVLLLTKDEEEALRLYNQLLFYHNRKAAIYYFPSFDTIPYDRLSPKAEILAQRAKVLSELTRLEEPCILVSSVINLLSPLPPAQEIKNTVLELKAGLKLSAKNLTAYLSNNGFCRSPTAAYSGEYAIRGEIVDIVLPEEKAYRIHFSWEHIESIKTYNIDTQLSELIISSLKLNAASEIILNENTIKNFKENYVLSFGVSSKGILNSTSLPLYEAITQGRKFPGYENLLPLFYNKVCYLQDYIQDPVIIYDNFCLQTINEHIDNVQDFYRARANANIVTPSNYYPALPPEKVCLNYRSVNQILNDEQNIFISPENSDFAANINLVANNAENITAISQAAQIILENRLKICIICYSARSSLERLKTLFANYDFLTFEVNNLADAKVGMINFACFSLTQSFSTGQYLFFADNELLPERVKSPQKNVRKLKNILAELDNIQEGELVVHEAHGIGQFLKIETLQISGKPHDCLKILYAENTKLYIPVENIDILKKYGTGEVELDKLGNASWQKRKSKLKDRINNIAAGLLKIAASRKAFVSKAIEFDLELYEKFCHKFQFVETEDQLRAINDIKEDLTSGRLMDRLICGDVGYGKTEVAMRAAFMVASSESSVDSKVVNSSTNSTNNTTSPQIVIIAPTTILCKQHYLRFKERFNQFGYNVRQLSRLIKASEIKKIKQEIKTGAAHIIVGTHALLASNIEFDNLKMVIIDEEQHFGVSQKERLKELKSGTHVLALSATPIPRTLQMSMVGIKDLSLIATPPLDRIPIRTTVMPFDGVIIREALLREHQRGGKSFYVCPRISELFEVEKKLREMVPELKYKIAHGQMTPTSVDEIMTNFYESRFDILLSTTIIESGIDVASANTIVIHNSDKLGLSQLYQLRGRVGRSKVRGYAYLTISNKISTKLASRRLEIMQNVDSLGAGFTIASHDMDLRGFGNLVGDQQSGHIKEVGVELYQEMLDEAISCLSYNASDTTDFSKKEKSFTPSINLGLPIYIAEEYIADSPLRLALYHRIGNLKDIEEIENFRDEMIDRFGDIPAEFNNLLEIVKIKQLCIQNHIEALDSGPQGFLIKFRQDADISSLILNFVQKYPHHTKIKSDNKLVFIRDLKQENIIFEINKFFNELKFNSQLI